MTARTRQQHHSGMPPPESLGPVDRAWLEMDEPRNPMVVSAILELEGSIRTATLRRLLADRLLRYHRFRQRAAAEQTPPQWVTDEGFNLDYHVRVVRLPRGASDRELRRVIARELGKGLDRGMPLWRLTLLRRRRNAATVLFQGHHAMGDGMAFLHVLMNCADGREPPEPSGHAAAEGARSGPLGRLIGRLEGVNAALESLHDLAVDDLLHPSHVLEQLREGKRTIAAVGRILALPDDNPSELRNPLSGHRAVGWTSGLPFEPIHQLARECGVKVNDVFVAALAGAFGRYLREGSRLLREHQNLRVSIPVNLRSDDDRGMGNYFGLVLLDLPVGVRDWRKRLQLVSERARSLKQSPEARAVLLALAVAGHMPVPLERRLVDLVGGKAVAVVSNLPGPRETLSIGGARLANMVFWPPQAGGIGIGVSLFSYAGQVTVGVTADVALIDDPQHLVGLFETELRDMLRSGAIAQAARD